MGAGGTAVGVLVAMLIAIGVNVEVTVA